jgi:hypothetical protein
MFRQVKVRFEVEDCRALKAFAADDGESCSTLIRRVIRMYLRARLERETRQKSGRTDGRTDG